MARAQIILDDWQYDALRALSDARGESMSFLVREAIAEYLNTREQPRDAKLSDIEGMARDRQASGRRHDEVLYRPRPRR